MVIDTYNDTYSSLSTFKILYHFYRKVSSRHCKSFNCNHLGFKVFSLSLVCNSYYDELLHQLLVLWLKQKKPKELTKQVKEGSVAHSSKVQTVIGSWSPLHPHPGSTERRMPELGLLSLFYSFQDPSLGNGAAYIQGGLPHVSKPNQETPSSTCPKIHFHSQSKSHQPGKDGELQPCFSVSHYNDKILEKTR